MFSKRKMREQEKLQEKAEMRIINMCAKFFGTKYHDKVVSIIKDYAEKAIKNKFGASGCEKLIDSFGLERYEPYFAETYAGAIKWENYFDWSTVAAHRKAYERNKEYAKRALASAGEEKVKKIEDLIEANAEEFIKNYKVSSDYMESAVRMVNARNDFELDDKNFDFLMLKTLKAGK